MAHSIRIAKSGGDWTKSDLAAYNIKLARQDQLTFFGIQSLPPPQVDPELLTAYDAADATNEQNAKFLTLLHNVHSPFSGESAVVDFAVELFEVLGYANKHRVVKTWVDLPFVSCGEIRNARSDVCLVDREHGYEDILLVVQEDKRFIGVQDVDPEAQLIVQAIAAFSINNKQRLSAGKDPINAMVCPRIFFPSSDIQH
ncbi:hypothetical protein JVT61DRAFT_3500 [Boletus reticuloceps]|uniref:Uncharacterized protein n=1 Tax=Boletus reticuloceps TaxID=495285 RepID=A0A8I2YM25_9AGAM|nr:hypothetical protein JVT61DRAFT_3500 [Boletus reticuloceps]